MFIVRHRDIIEGKDGYLFLTGGRHHVLEYFSGERKPTERSIINFCQNAERRSLFCKKKEISFSTWVFPEKIFVLRELVEYEKPIISLFQNVYTKHNLYNKSLPLFYPIDDIYYSHYTRTDTHFSSKGYISILNKIISHYNGDLIESFNKYIHKTLIQDLNFSGDLGRTLDPHRSEKQYVFDRRRLPPYEIASNGIVHGSDGLLLLQKSSYFLVKNTLLIFGDSFFLHMLPLLSIIFQKIIFCRTRYFHYELIDSIKPDVVFCGIAERYLSECFLDENRPHFFAYSMIRGKTMIPDDGLPRLWSEFFKNDALI